MDIRPPRDRVEHRAALCRLIDPTGVGDPATEDRVEVLERYIKKRGLTLKHCLIAAEGNRIHTVCVLLDSPGRTSSVLLSPGAAQPAARSFVVQMLDASRREAARRGIQLLQGMVPPECAEESLVYAAAGFSPLAHLIYMQREGSLSDAPRTTHRLRWESYGPHTHHLFAEIIEQTYKDSLDCGSLNGERRIEDILASHKATGRFDPELWRIGYADQEPVGVILLAYMEEQQTHELVYMGCLPYCRGRGYGASLLAHGLEMARAHGVPAMTLSVDEKNAPARKLYGKFGFRESARRDVWIRILSSPNWH